MFDPMSAAEQPWSADAVHGRVRHPRARSGRGSAGSPTSSTWRDEPFLVLADVTIEEFGSRGRPLTRRLRPGQPRGGPVRRGRHDASSRGRELRTPKSPEQAMISIPPFKITGPIHLLPERDLREALTELTGAVHPGDRGDLLVGHGRRGRGRRAHVVAINHSRAQILAPHKEVDPWAGLDTRADRGGPRCDGRALGGRRRPHRPAAGRRRSHRWARTPPDGGGAQPRTECAASAPGAPDGASARP